MTEREGKGPCGPQSWLTAENGAEWESNPLRQTTGSPTDEFIEGERVDKCEYREGRVDRCLSSSSEMRRRSRVQVPHRSRADLRAGQAK